MDLGLGGFWRLRGHTVWGARLGQHSIVIDAGAHRGEFARQITNLFGCRCIQIEANPMLAQSLQSTSVGATVQAALGAQDGNAIFVFSNNLEAGSIARGGRGEGCSVRVISVPTLMRENHISKVHLLKLDIEGSEFSLLNSLSDELLSSIEQITVEFHDFLPEFQDRDLYREARRRLACLGFVCCRMTFRSNGDVLFLNKKLLGIGPLRAVYFQIMIRWFMRLALELRQVLGARVGRHA